MSVAGMSGGGFFGLGRTNRFLGLEAKSPEAPPIEDDTTPARIARRTWARLTKKIYEVDPLFCPSVPGP